MSDERREEDLENRLKLIAKRIQSIADQEARSALVRGYGSRGEFVQEKENLINRTDEILDELEALYRPRGAQESP